MKKNINCESCQLPCGEEYLCDTCGKNLLNEYYGVPLTLDCSYGSDLDGETYHFCDNKCLAEFLKSQEPKDDRFEFGGA
jgi:hypothetical protein